MPDLAPQITQKIKALCAKGYRYYDQNDHKTALRVFYQAWLLVPKPQIKWEEAGWVLTAIGDAYFRLTQYQHACEALNSALHCPNLGRAPFIHLRLGQCLLEQGDTNKARQSLHRAYSIGGKNAFANEPAQYLRAIEDLIID